MLAWPNALKFAYFVTIEGFLSFMLVPVFTHPITTTALQCGSMSHRYLIFVISFMHVIYYYYVPKYHVGILLSLFIFYSLYYFVFIADEDDDGLNMRGVHQFLAGIQKNSLLDIF